MKKSLLIFSFLSFIFSTTQAQTLNKKAKRSPYISFLEEGNRFAENGYHYQIERTPKGKYIYKQFYPTKKTLTHYRTYDNKMKYLDGPAKDWWDSGDLWREGQYVKSVKTGIWKEYFKGRVSNFGPYENGKKNGLWTRLDSLQNITSTYEYIDGLPNGKFQEFDSLGVLENEGIMEMGKIISQTKVETEEDGQWKMVEKMPMFPGCEGIEVYKEQKKCADQTMLQFIYKRIKYPRLARREGIEGSAVIQFVVEKDGTIEKITARRGVCKEIEEECIKLIKSFPIWHPGEQRDEPVRVQFNLPIKFRLE